MRPHGTAGASLLLCCSFYRAAQGLQGWGGIRRCFVAFGHLEGLKGATGGKVKADSPDLRAVRSPNSLHQVGIAAAEVAAPIRPAQRAAKVDSVIHTDILPRGAWTTA